MQPTERASAAMRETQTSMARCIARTHIDTPAGGSASSASGIGLRLAAFFFIGFGISGRW